MTIAEIKAYLENAQARADADFAAASKANDIVGVARSMGTLSGAITCALIDIKILNERTA
jgi:hypothetical protein